MLNPDLGINTLFILSLFSDAVLTTWLIMHRMYEDDECYIGKDVKQNGSCLRMYDYKLV
jgi:hypothetical protein